MHQSLAILTFDTDGQGFREITDDVNSWLHAADIRMGQVTLFCQPDDNRERLAGGAPRFAPLARRGRA
jgi:hypothetical protein